MAVRIPYVPLLLTAMLIGCVKVEQPVAETQQDTGIRMLKLYNFSGESTRYWEAWENEGILINGDQALSMGNYYFTGPDGKETKVEYSFGYALDDDGKLRINLHHSSLPYDADS